MRSSVLDLGCPVIGTMIQIGHRIILGVSSRLPVRHKNFKCKKLRTVRLRAIRLALIIYGRVFWLTYKKIGITNVPDNVQMDKQQTEKLIGNRFSVVEQVEA